MLFGQESPGLAAGKGWSGGRRWGILRSGKALGMPGPPSRRASAAAERQRAAAAAAAAAAGDMG